MTLDNDELPKTFVLNNGVQIPTVGLGTWQAPLNATRDAVSFALQQGYRHLDCAYIYLNEREVGEGIRASGVPRSEVFVTSKVWNLFQDDVAGNLEKTLDNLGLDYVDLYNTSLTLGVLQLVHWPIKFLPADAGAPNPLRPLNPDGTYKVDRTWDQGVTWAGMEAVYAAGKARAIGVCNWSIPYLEALAKSWKVVPAVNQVENHPFLPQHALKAWCDARGILLEAYSPLGGPGAPVLQDEDIVAVAKRNGVTPATVLISYQVNRGIVPLPKSVSHERLVQNLRVVRLSAEDMALLDGLAAKGKAQRLNKPPFCWDLGFDDWD
ncbi:D-galacturonate reductase [Vanrija pseudolonga]|uniref:D-galacturonate reductase n=1 Tax=Vanrija pseudolonga TaxID=143232 RepID=A0AAF1BMC7_9TREE|nr:D-galacturonate reductase [Vanrija pseudolonga]